MKKKIELKGVFEGKLVDCIVKLQDYANKHPHATIELKLDFDGCFYESDTPSPQVVITP